MPCYTVNNNQVVLKDKLPTEKIDITLKEDNKLYAVISFENVNQLRKCIKILAELHNLITYGNKTVAIDKFRKVEMYL